MRSCFCCKIVYKVWITSLRFYTSRTGIEEFSCYNSISWQSNWFWHAASFFLNFIWSFLAFKVWIRLNILYLNKLSVWSTKYANNYVPCIRQGILFSYKINVRFCCKINHSSNQQYLQILMRQEELSKW